MRTILFCAAVMCVSPRTTQAQTIAIREINPTWSTRDAEDPDGATGGRVNGLARTRSGKTIWAASELGGLWKSNNAGRTWHPSHNHLPLRTVDVEVDPTNDNKVYATSWWDGRVAALSGISVSVDGGAHWQKPATSVPPPGFCYFSFAQQHHSAFGIAIDPDNARRVFIGTLCGLAVSSDAGVTWQFIDPSPGDLARAVFDVVVHHRGIIDVCGDNGHQRSVDGGATWTTAQVLPFFTAHALPGGQCSIAASPDEPHVLIAVSGVTLYESDNGGGHWKNGPVNPKWQGRIPFVVTNQRTGRTFDLWFGDVRLYRATCETRNPPIPNGPRRCPLDDWAGPYTRSVGGHDDMGDILFSPADTVDACPILMSSDGGVYYNRRTSKSNCHRPRWEQPDSTPRALWLWTMGGAHQAGVFDEDLYLGAQDNGTFATTRAGVTRPDWRNVRCCDAYSTTASADRVMYLRCCFTQGRTNRLFLRRRGMTSGGEAGSYPPGDFYRTDANFYPTVVRFRTNQFAVATTAGVFTTRDVVNDGLHWTRLGSDTMPPWPYALYVGTQLNTPTFYAFGQGHLWRLSMSFFDTTPHAPGSPDWARVAPPGNVGVFRLVAIHPRNPGRIFASHVSSAERMVLTSDGGLNWTFLPQLDSMMNANGAFEWSRPSLVAFDPEDPRVLVAGSENAGVFLSTDAGVTWRRITDPFDPVDSGKPHIPIPMAAFFDHDRERAILRATDIYIASMGRGVWRVTLQWTPVLHR